MFKLWLEGYEDEPQKKNFAHAYSNNQSFLDQIKQCIVPILSPQ